MEIIIGLPKELSNQEKIEEFYKDLNLNGSEKLIKTMLEMKKHYQKIKNSPSKSAEVKFFNIIKQEKMKYFSD